jgi:hypothetical protein
VLRLLASGRLEAGQTGNHRAQLKASPLTWLAQLAAMLADEPLAPAARAAAFQAIAEFPGLRYLGHVLDPEGRPGVAIAEQASNLHRS